MRSASPAGDPGAARAEASAPRAVPLEDGCGREGLRARAQAAPQAGGVTADPGLDSIGQTGGGCFVMSNGLTIIGVAAFIANWRRIRR